jgi:hypothetical protein
VRIINVLGEERHEQLVDDFALANNHLGQFVANFTTGGA